MFTQGSIDKKPWLIFEIILNGSLIFLQYLEFIASDIFLIYTNWYIILSPFLEFIDILLFVFSCYLLYKIFYKNKIEFTFILIQCLGVLFSIINYQDFMKSIIYLGSPKFILVPYLVFLVLYFCLISVVILIHRINPNYLINFQNHGVEKKRKLKIIFDLDNFEYIKSEAEQENKSVSQFMNDIVYQHIQSCGK